MYSVSIYIIIYFLLFSSLTYAQESMNYYFETEEKNIRNQLAKDELSFEENLRLKLRLADIYLENAKYKQSYETYSQVVNILLEQNKKNFSPVYKSLLPIVYVKQGLTLFYQGKTQEADHFFKQAIHITKAIKEGSRIRSSILADLCTLNLDIGAFEDAKDFCEEAKNLIGQIYGKSHPLYASILENLGTVYGEIGNYSKAFYLIQKAFNILRSAAQKYRNVSLKRIARNMGYINLILNNFEQAYKIFTKYDIKDGLVLYYINKGLWDEGEQLLNELDTKSPQLSYKDERYKIALMIGFGYLYERKQKWQRAFQYYQKAIKMIEKSWYGIPLIHRRNFLSAKIGMNFKRSDAYEGALRCLFYLKSVNVPELSFSFIEDIKSTRFLELLSDGNIKLKSLNDNKIWEQDKKFQIKIIQLEQRLRKIVQTGKLDRLSKLEHLKKEVLDKYEKFLKQASLKSPMLGSLLKTTTPHIKNVQGLIPNDTVLLNYFLGYNSSFLLVITQKECNLIKLSVDRAMLRKKMEICSPNNLDADCVSEFYSTLIGPAEKYLKNAKNIIISPDCELFHIAWPGLKKGENFLIDRFNLSIIPSASVFVSLKKNKKKAPKMLLGFGNPTTQFASLPSAEREVLSIQKYFSDAKIFVHKDATEENFYQYAPIADVIHIASHGFFNKTHPLLSAVVLRHTSTYDGYLRIAEIFHINLNKSDLIVLSTCFSGSHYVTSGGEIIGLSRAVFYAGANSVIVANWAISDDATQLLMINFYKNWLKNDMTKAEALRRAQLELKKNSIFSDPYYWATFQLIGL